MADCHASNCDEPAALQWQRWATPEELAQLRADGEIGPDETEAKLPIFGCDTHKITLELAALVHDATCAAPPTCDCSASTGRPDAQLD